MPDKNTKWVPLHVHSEYSPLDGAIQISDIVKFAGDNNVGYVCITDHGYMSSAVDLENKAKQAGLTPMFGCELYARSLLDENDNNNYHLLAIAKTKQGYFNLIKMLSESHKPDNFYKKPRVNAELIEKYSEGIIFSTACAAGELAVNLMNENFYMAEAYLKKMKSLIYGKDSELYVELLDIGEGATIISKAKNAPEGTLPIKITQDEINKRANDLAKKLDIPTILTTDSHYMPEFAEWYKYTVAIGNKSVVKNEDGNVTQNEDEWLEGFDLSLKTPEYMYERWKNIYPDALANTVRIAESIENFSVCQPDYILPKTQDEAQFRLQAQQGLENRLLDIEKYKHNEYRERLEYELNIVCSMGFVDYFTMVADTIKWGLKSDIYMGPGRGSAAGSLLAFALRITQVDPLRYGLLFERFLNPERVSMPDIDFDVEDKERPRMLQHLRDTYGAEAVSGICNYNRPQWKNALRDAARVKGVSPVDSNIFVSGLSDYIETLIGNKIAPEDADINEMAGQSLKSYLPIDMKREICKLGSKFCGILRGYGTHASGIVIAPPQVTNYVPRLSIGGELVTQFDMSGIDAVKLIKVDMLGLATLTSIRNTINLIGETNKETIVPTPDYIYGLLNRHRGDTAFEIDTKNGISKDTIDKMNLTLKRGLSTGVFQFESPGMKKLLQKMYADGGIEKISAISAIYRPGPLNSGIKDSYQKMVLGEESEPLFPGKAGEKVKEVAADAHGVPIYQEHIMKIAQEMAGYSLGGADILRRAMGKKKKEVMEKERKNFVEGSVKNGFSAEEANATFDKMEFFCGYAFNKSHSTAYAYLSFITAWFKANYAEEFWAALLEANTDKTKEKWIDKAKECSWEFIDKKKFLLPPLLEIGKELRASFSTEKTGIRIGAVALNGISTKSFDKIQSSVKGFENLNDFLNFYITQQAQQVQQAGILKKQQQTEKKISQQEAESVENIESPKSEPQQAPLTGQASGLTAKTIDKFFMMGLFDNCFKKSNLANMDISLFNLSSRIKPLLFRGVLRKIFTDVKGLVDAKNVNKEDKTEIKLDENDLLKSFDYGVVSPMAELFTPVWGDKTREKVLSSIAYNGIVGGIIDLIVSGTSKAEKENERKIKRSEKEHVTACEKINKKLKKLENKTAKLFFDEEEQKNPELQLPVYMEPEIIDIKKMVEQSIGLFDKNMVALSNVTIEQTETDNLLRMEILKNAHLIEKEAYSIGLIVSDWELASVICDNKFAFYIDEFHTFNSMIKNGFTKFANIKNDQKTLVKSAIKEGVWTLGYFSKQGKRDNGWDYVELSGRDGFSNSRMIVQLSKDIKIDNKEGKLLFDEGQLVATRLRMKEYNKDKLLQLGSNVWKTDWECAEMVGVPLDTDKKLQLTGKIYRADSTDKLQEFLQNKITDEEAIIAPINDQNTIGKFGDNATMADLEVMGKTQQKKVLDKSVNIEVNAL